MARPHRRQQSLVVVGLCGCVAMALRPLAFLASPAILTSAPHAARTRMRAEPVPERAKVDEFLVAKMTDRGKLGSAIVRTVKAHGEVVLRASGAEAVQVAMKGIMQANWFFHLDGENEAEVLAAVAARSDEVVDNNVGVFLERVGLGQHATALAENSVSDMEFLRSMDKADFRACGLPVPHAALLRQKLDEAAAQGRGPRDAGPMTFTVKAMATVAAAADKAQVITTPKDNSRLPAFAGMLKGTIVDNGLARMHAAGADSIFRAMMGSSLATAYLENEGGGKVAFVPHWEKVNMTNVENFTVMAFDCVKLAA